jgi:hypothetical protein
MQNAEYGMAAVVPPEYPWRTRKCGVKGSVRTGRLRPLRAGCSGRAPRPLGGKVNPPSLRFRRRPAAGLRRTRWRDKEGGLPKQVWKPAGIGRLESESLPLRCRFRTWVTLKIRWFRECKTHSCSAGNSRCWAGYKIHWCPGGKIHRDPGGRQRHWSAASQTHRW